MFSAGGGTPLGFPFGSERPYSAEDEVTFKDDGNIHLLLYTDGLVEAKHRVSRKDCEAYMVECYRDVVSDPGLADKSTALLSKLESEGYDLSADDCTAISIHMLDPARIVVEQQVPRNIYLVSDVAKQTETAVRMRGHQCKYRRDASVVDYGAGGQPGRSCRFE